MMKKMLITGGTVFVSRFAAQYFSDKYEVYVLNRNTREQCKNVNLIQADRNHLGDVLQDQHFDVVLDITAYSGGDVENLLNALDSFDDYVLISSSAVYPESAKQPFREETRTGYNCFWGKYGTDKIEAERALLSRVPNAYVLRPPYLYGPGNNVYREAFVFDCAIQDRVFYLPGDGDMKLQFLHVKDLCRFIEVLLKDHPKQNVYNVGNDTAITVRDWVSACYHAAGKDPVFCRVGGEIEQRKYFPFYNYEYFLDVTKQREQLLDVIPMMDGLRESYAWYLNHENLVNRKPLVAFIDQVLAK